MVKDVTARNGLPSSERQISLSGFFSRLLPSHRAEQGGTVRSHDITSDSDSAYVDLGIDPNDLTEWNLAQERSLRSSPSRGSTSHQHHKGRSWSTQRGRSRLRDGRGRSPHIPQRTPSLRLARPPKPLEPLVPELSSQGQHSKSHPLTTDEIRDVLKTKEDRRKHRRSLKESGDWLGVQGADPYSGEFAVLTPTNTVSSEATPPSIKNRLAELSRRQTTAKIAYEKAKLEEETERERILLQKGQSKLEKMEHAKEELRHLHQEFPTWSQHRRRWSSAAEPDLSPIPQSLKSGKVGGSSDEAVAAASIRNFSRPSDSKAGSVRNQPKLVGPSGNSEITGPSKPDLRNDRSTDTIIHKVLPNMNCQDPSIKTKGMVYPPVFSDTSDSPPQEQKNEKYFLWRRRRRMTDPGKLGKCPNVLVAHSSAGTTDESLVFTSVEHPPPLPQLHPRHESKDHFPNLFIPDPHLHLVPYLGGMERMENLLSTRKRDQTPETPARPAQASHSEAQKKPALRIATNLSGYRDPPTDPSGVVPDTKKATATSFQLKPKGDTKLPPTYRRLIPILRSSSQEKVISAQESQTQSQNTSRSPSQIESDLPIVVVGSQSVHHQSNSHKIPRTNMLDRHTGINMNKCYEKDRGASVSTPTITITGYDRDRDPQLLLEEIQSRINYRGDRKASVVGSDEILVTSSSHSGEQVLYNELMHEKEWRTTTPSRLITPQSDLQSFTLARRTPETDIISTDLATSWADPTISAQWLQSHGSYQKLKKSPMKSAPGKLEESVAIYPQHQRVVNEEPNIQAKEFNTNPVSLPHHRQNTAQLAHQHPTPGEHKEAMIQEAARIAMRRSRAREIVTTRSRTPSRTPSPRIQETRRTILSHHSGKIRPENASGGNGAVNIDFPLISIGSIDLHTPSHSPQQGPLHRSPGWVKGHINTDKMQCGKDMKKQREPRRSDKNTEAGSVAIFVSLLITASMILFGLACAWWVMVKPAFDQRSNLWRRRRRRESTLEDISIFAAAAVFCTGGALILTSAIRTALWIVLQLKNCVSRGVGWSGIS
ncbi:hypothetical protein F5Y12DRAFT_641078 [Xylaria sp. FL1777]|nr:hypothetical protein F5Y12DRAFT_641078 [Xylaria sp. FL1777]